MHCCPLSAWLRADGPFQGMSCWYTGDPLGCQSSDCVTAGGCRSEVIQIYRTWGFWEGCVQRMSEPAMCVISDSTECDRCRVHEAASKNLTHENDTFKWIFQTCLITKKREGLVYVRGAFWAHWDIISKTVLFQLLSVWFVNKTSDIREHSSPPAQFTSHVGKWCLAHSRRHGENCKTSWLTSNCSLISTEDLFLFYHFIASRSKVCPKIEFDCYSV